MDSASIELEPVKKKPIHLAIMTMVFPLIAAITDVFEFAAMDLSKKNWCFDK